MGKKEKSEEWAKVFELAILRYVNLIALELDVPWCSTRGEVCFLGVRMIPTFMRIQLRVSFSMTRKMFRFSMCLH